MPDDDGVKIKTDGDQNNIKESAGPSGNSSNIQSVSVSGSKNVTARNVGDGKLEIDVKLPNSQSTVQPTDTPTVQPSSPPPNPVVPPTSPNNAVPDTATPSEESSAFTPAPTENNPDEQPDTKQEEQSQNDTVAPTDQILPIEQLPTNPTTPNDEQTTPPGAPPQEPAKDEKNNAPDPLTPTPPPEGTPPQPNQNPNTNPSNPQLPANGEPAKIASDMNADKQKKKTGFKDRMENLKPSNIAKNTASAIREAPRKMANNAIKNIKQIGNDLRSTRQRKINILKKIDDINKEIKALQSKIAGLMPSWKMALFRLCFPGLYSRLMGILEIPGDKMQSVKVKILEAKYTALQGVKVILEMSRFAAAVFDSFLDIIELTMPTFGIIWLLSPIYLLLSVPFHFFIGGTISSGLKMITKEVSDILKPMKERLDREKKILNLMNQRRGMRTEIKNMPAREGALRRQQEAQAAMAAQQSAQEANNPPEEPEQPEPAGAPA